jgi:glycosyltransferase involved in cell wall biosynthesis
MQHIHSRQTNQSPIQTAGQTGLRISVVIPHLNQPQMLERCLASLQAGARLPDEVFVVDNGSALLPVQICAGFPNLRLLQEPTPGPGPARNLGVGAATGDILAFIDADCLADPQWLAQAEAAMADPSAQILGGDVRIAYVDPGRLTLLEAYESIYAYRMDRYIAREGFTGTGNLVVRRDVLAQVGPFAGIGVAEDRDWGQRATAMGHQIRYVGLMRVYHPARADFTQLRQKWDRHMAHDFVKAGKGAKGRLKWTAKMLAMAISPLAEVPRIVISDRIGGLRSRVFALCGVTRIRMYRAAKMAWLLCGGDPAKLAGRWNRPKS